MKMILVKVIEAANLKLNLERPVRNGVNKNLMFMMMHLKPLVQMANIITVEIQTESKNQFGATQQILIHHGSYVIQ